MATTRLSDAVIPEVYMTYTALNNPELTAFYQAGLVVRTPYFDQRARTAGAEFVLPFWQDLDPNIEPNMSNDDPADLAVPNKVTSGQQKARKAFVNQGFSSMDLIVELTGSDPMMHIRNRFGTYWMRQWQRRLIASVVGIYNANVAQNGGDMVVNISAAAGTDAIFNSDAVIDASGTMGDAAGRFTGIAVHSAVRTRMLKNNEIEFIQDSEGRLIMEVYKGLRVIVDDNMPVLSGAGADRVFLSVLMGGGAWGFGEVDGSAFAEGEGVPRVPVEVERNPRAGNGGGEETLWERKTQILHPLGFSWDDLEDDETNAITEFSPTLADLRIGEHWTRVVNRKQAPFAFLVSKA